MIAIHTSIFNVESMRFKWREAIQNWFQFLAGTGEIIIAINISHDKTPELVRAYCERLQSESPQSNTKIKIVDIDIPYTNPAFDGLGKAAALSHVTQPYAVLLDIDEFLVPSQRKLWMGMVRELENRRNIDALLVPVVDLFGDEQHFSKTGSKWYLHRNNLNLTRGVVNFARRADGTFDTKLSDSCELIAKDTGELVRAAPILMPELPDFLKITTLESGETPFVVHTGYLDLEQRLRQTEFWKNHWENREGKPGSQPKTTLADLEKIKRYRHNLPDWRVAQ